VNAPAALWAVLPVKGFARAKTRLGHVLPDPLRAAFARGLFEHVIGTIQALHQVRGVVVLTDDDEVESLTRARGAHVLRDGSSPGLAAIVDRGLAYVADLGADAAFVCMADLPHLRSVELRLVVAALEEHAVVVAPDAERAGTNLLGLKPPLLFPSCFGRLDSFECHIARARTAGHGMAVLEAHGLCFDVDAPEDLQALEP
jgi:2-phospho-L-lactate guanylyltransferase